MQYSDKLGPLCSAKAYEAVTERIRVIILEEILAARDRTEEEWKEIDIHHIADTIAGVIPVVIENVKREQLEQEV